MRIRKLKLIDVIKIKLSLAKKIKELFEERLKETHHLSFQSMLVLLEQKLKTSQDLQAINKQFEFMIIDEFQDTDPLQLNILKRLFVDHAVKGFYMVGDPKQAIYAFRSADVYSYLEAKRTISQLEIYSLDTCYRSTSAVIESLNAFFSKALWIELPHLDEALPYQKVKFAPRHYTDNPHCFHFYHLNKNEDDTEKQMALLASLLTEKHPHDSLAILVKDRFQLDRMEKHLKLLKVATQSVKNETLEHAEIYDLLYTFLSLLDEPMSIGSLNKWLVSPWFNLSIEFFEKSNLDHQAPMFFSAISELKEIFSLHGFIASLEKCLGFRLSPHQTLRSSLASLYGQDIDHKLFEVASLIADVQNLRSIKLLKITLEEAKKSAFKLPQIQLSDSPVTLITSHMSKGLEYDHVIALGTCMRHENSAAILIKRLNNQLTLGPDNKDALSEKAYHDLDAEKLRQLYVALTRAKKSIHVPIISYEKPSVDLGCSSPFEYYLYKIFSASKSYRDTYLSSYNLDISQFVKSTFTNEFFVHLSQLEEPLDHHYENQVFFIDKTKKAVEIKIEKSLSFTSLKTESINYKIDDPLKGKDYGDFFHFLMEKMIKESFYKDVLSAASQQFLKNLITLSSFKEHAETIMQHVKNAFSLKFFFKESSFCLAEKSPSELFVEEAFCYETDTGIMKGFIDLVIIHDDHVFFIDWKTSLLNDITPEGLKKHMKQASYDLQMKIYFEALQTLNSYFLGKSLAKAFYVFIKQNAIYETEFGEISCLN